MVATIPYAARVVHAAPRPADGEPSVWALVPKNHTEQTKSVCLAGTGCALPEIAPGYHWAHVTTFFEGAFVFHVFVESVGS